MPVNPILARVREVILEAGKSQNALAREGIGTQAMISKWFVNDEAEPSAGSLAKLCEHLSVSGHWLLTGQGDKRAIDAGADALFNAGVTAGRSQAIQAIVGLPPTSLAPEVAEEIADRVLQAGADLAAHTRQQQRTRRRSSGGG